MATVKISAIPSELTGLSPGNSAHCDPAAAGLPDSAVNELTALWSRAYGRPVSRDEIAEIYRNVRYLVETLI
jgi:hypothetical protein